MESNIKGNANFIKDTKPIWTPFFSAMPATITFAEAPMSVPFPPRHAPKDNAHQSGSNSVGEIPPKLPIWWISGIIVATKGMLSTKAEAIAENHKISIPVSVKLPAVAVNAH